VANAGVHRAVYAVAILAVLHFYWMRAGKNDFAEVLVYGVLLAMLLGWRVWHQWRCRRRVGRRNGTPSMRTDCHIIDSAAVDKR
jgi:DMSO/TMAO reductase YedYZ heme-binding membrane subunit